MGVKMRRMGEIYRTLSTKTKAVPFHESIHFLPSLKWEGPSDLFADLVESPSCLLRSFFCQSWVFG